MSLSPRQYRNEMAAELQRIISFWKRHAIDNGRGGFFLERSIIQTTRMPISKRFSIKRAHYFGFFLLLIGQPATPTVSLLLNVLLIILKIILSISNLAGVYWTVTANGESHDTKKSRYALAFALYGCSEY